MVQLIPSKLNCNFLQAQSHEFSIIFLYFLSVTGDAVSGDGPTGIGCVSLNHFYHPFHLISDIDECVTETQNCSNDTVCNNTKGGFNCMCKAGFTGDGQNCTG